jgi:hypothetical protein
MLVNEVNYYRSIESIKEVEWNTFIEALVFVESTNDSLTVNNASGATGSIQITEIYVDELNRLGFDYSYEDRLSHEKSIEMFNAYNGVHNPEKSIQYAITLHNPNAGNWYRQRIMNKINELNGHTE